MGVNHSGSELELDERDRFRLLSYQMENKLYIYITFNRIYLSNYKSK
jgi:hypothetical protein